VSRPALAPPVPPSPGDSLLAVATSDLHWLDGGPRDDFRAPEGDRLKAECEALAPLVKRTRARVILLGDVADFWRAEERSVCPAHFADLAAVANIPDDAFSRPVMWCRGNHDARMRLSLLAAILRDRFVIVRDCDVGGWHFEHGDRFDPNPGVWRKVGKGACKALAWIGGVISPRAEDWLSAKASAVEGLGRYGDADCYQEAALRLAKERGLRGVCLGHTHRAAYVEREGVAYTNCGTWAEDGWTLWWASGSVTRFKG